MYACMHACTYVLFETKLQYCLMNDSYFWTQVKSLGND